MDYLNTKTFFRPDQNYQTTSSHFSFPFGFGVGDNHEVLSPNSVAYVENYFRPMIREEVEAKINARFNVSTNYQSCSNSSTSREGVLGEDRAVVIVGGGRLRTENQQQLKLRFTNKVSSTVFTVNDIEAENGEELRVELFDAVNDRIIDATHPLSSASIEVVVLDGEFNDGEAITQSDFNRSVVPERLGERPLLVGRDKRFRLEKGVYSITDLSFTRNSSRSRTKKICLGLRVTQDSNNNYPTIGHTVSNPFRVKDHRGQLNKKHHPPKGEDEVWRLEGIGRNGEYHKRLTSHTILNVDDFLKAYQKDSRSLRKWLGNRVSEKKWKSMVKHAEEYVPITNAFVPTFDPLTSFQQNLVENEAMGGVEEVSNQNNIGDGFQDHTSLSADVIQDHFYRIFQDYPIQTLLSQGEASTSNGLYNYVDQLSTSTCNQSFQGAAFNKLVPKSK
ncbi:calmodulin-binding protein 60 B isoform X2 [Cucumis sativus]|uniref:calmodulin-binding protein 60 B isoform X2 n=1 Tax=Cucumis sativus TaxID=3659 RepID=UPI0005ED3076|nr:calmodulin-binding protein 60 B isoform X2 [Cucumis sativus]KAE8653349.1 hypothetical protein Csa_007610 [Cucumis sativus]